MNRSLAEGSIPSEWKHAIVTPVHKSGSKTDAANYRPISVLTILMNRSLAEGSTPSEWKHAIVTPEHKSGSKTDAANYRPISVLPVFVKILEHAVHNMVYCYLQDNQLLST